MSIADRLQMVIKMNGMTNASFADAIGVQRSSISHVLSGRNKPSVDFIQKILDTFPRVDANWLVVGRKVGRLSAEDHEFIQQPEMDKKEALAAANVINAQEVPEAKAKAPESTQKSIDKVIVFYTDGTYEELKKE